jgi:hypothetical protein
MNFVCKHPNLSTADIERVIEAEPFTWLDSDATVLDILVHADIFPSKGQARKNWHGITEIPVGCTLLQRVGKKKQDLFVFRAPEDLEKETA